MKFILVVFICLVLWLLINDAHSSTWQVDSEQYVPKVSINIVAGPDENGFMLFKAFVRSEHFYVRLREDIDLVSRVEAYETLLYYAMIDYSHKPTAAPEPSTFLLLASGLGILISRRKKGDLKCHTF